MAPQAKKRAARSADARSLPQTPEGRSVAEVVLTPGAGLSPARFNGLVDALRRHHESENVPEGFTWHIEFVRGKDRTVSMRHWTEVASTTPRPPLSRLDCDLTHVLASDPRTPDGQPAPTFAEVTYLLRLSGTALKRHSQAPGSWLGPPDSPLKAEALRPYPESPLATQAATLTSLVRLGLSHPKQEEATAAFKRANEVIFDALRVGLQLSPQGDFIEGELRHRGHYARAGRALKLSVLRALEAWESRDRTQLAADLVRVSTDGHKDLVFDAYRKVLAWDLAFLLIGAYGSAGIIDGPLGRPRRGKTFLRWPVQELGDPFAEVFAAVDSVLARSRWLVAQTTDTWQQAQECEKLAVRIVVAAAKARGFANARKRLFDADRKLRARSGAVR